jgi:hypothetical protein
MPDPVPPVSSSTPVTASASTKTTVDVVAARKKADENVQHKQDALKKANEAVARAHAELMQAQKEAAEFPEIKPVI